MDFPCEDFFNDEGLDDAPVVDKAALARATYKPKICSSQTMSDLTGDENGVKMSADYHYFLQDFTKARNLYKQVLSTPGINRSAAVRRDVIEGVARSSLRLGDFKEAEEFSDTLYSSSVSSNVDHMAVSISLKLDIAVASQYDLLEDYWLRRLIELHSLVPKYWLQLGNRLRIKDKIVESYCCLVRARELLRAVERSVGSFAKEGNAKMKLVVEDAIDKLEIADRTYDEVKIAMTSDIFGTGDTDAQDFEDLGRSARLKKLEEEFSENETGVKGDDDVEEFIEKFNHKWFSSTINSS